MAERKPDSGAARTHSPRFTIRAATIPDLPAIRDVRFKTAANDPVPPPKQLPPPYLRHLLETGTVLVAERAGEVVGHAGLTTGGGVAYLTDLFIQPDRQSETIGQTLLREVLPHDGTRLCTMASTDYRAVALYARAGMGPRWPNYVLEANSERLRELGAPRVETESAKPDDPALVAWDSAASGRPRPAECAFWAREEAAEALWFTRQGKRIGYGFVRPNAFSYAHGQAVALGPIGVHRARDAAACVGAAVAWARGRGSALELSLPGPHPALAPMLEAGFRITYVETFCASGAGDFVDPRRYVGSGSDLF